MSMKEKIMARVEECIALAEKNSFPEFTPIGRPTHTWNLRGGSLGGYYKHGLNCGPNGEFGWHLGLALENEEEYLNVVVPHEVAHHVVRIIWGHKAKPHGMEWKFIMSRVFKLEPSRTHNMDVSNFKQKRRKYSYKCGCRSGVMLSGIIHNRIKNGQRNYICRRCQTTLVLEKV